jgi:hypothetical protein
VFGVLCEALTRMEGDGALAEEEEFADEDMAGKWVESPD